MVKDPTTESTGTEKPGVKGRKPLALKLIVSVIVSALEVFGTPRPTQARRLLQTKKKISSSHPSQQTTAATTLTPRRRGGGSNPSQFVRHEPSLPLVIRADERRRTQSDPTELAATQTAAWPWGSRRSGL